MKTSHLPPCFELRRSYMAELQIGDLISSIPWEQHGVKLFGQYHLIPRLTAWFGEAGYTYSGVENKPLPIPSWLDAIRRHIARDTGAEYNSALFNYYRTGTDSVSWHADDEKELGGSPTIASLSIGASRRFSIKTRDDWARLIWNVELRNGDLLVMRDESQRDYIHSIPKTTIPVGPRINITFRWIG